jgi:A/G-specific adenine glycosylase
MSVQRQKRNDDGTVAARLLAWYDRGARDLPWRVPPGDARRADPYHVWLSEVMLQQTTVAAVQPYFAAFTARWPDVAALAAADDAAVMTAWAGLGYYARARNLLACARCVVADHGGRFPDDEAALRALPGIGAYTAAAIAAIAFDRRAVVVDGNVERVVVRLNALTAPVAALKPAIRAHVDTLTPDARAGDFAQAMMDLGATVCIPRAPRCGACPIADACAAQAAGIAADLPARAAKVARPQRQGRADWIERDGHVWLVRRPAKGLLGGMRALPGGEWTVAPNNDPHKGADAVVAHSFTHFDLSLAVHRVAGSDAPTESACTGTDGGEWWPLDGIEQAGLPSLYAKAAKAMIGRN